MNIEETNINISVDESHLALFEALASDVRLKILHLLARQGDMNVKSIAAELGLSSAIMSMHIRKLELGELICTNMITKDGAKQKICTLSDIDRVLLMPKKRFEEQKYHEFSLPIGHYTDISVFPTCGIATKKELIGGSFDDPIYFLDPRRVDAQIFWIGHGYVEYTLPNYITPDQKVAGIDISLELCSEAPGASHGNWPSDITFFINGVKLCTYTCPCEWGNRRALVSPDWWFEGLNQYGLLKNIYVNHKGTFIDGEYSSPVTLDDLNFTGRQWTLRIAILDEALNRGGLTLFGMNFGDYPQDIVTRIFYNANI